MPPALPAAPCLPHTLPIAPCFPPRGSWEPLTHVGPQPQHLPPRHFFSPALQSRKALGWGGGGGGGNIRERKGGDVPRGSGAPGPGLPGFQLQPHPYGPLPSRTDTEGRVDVGIWRKTGGTGHAQSAPGPLSSSPRPVLQTKSCVRRAGPSSRATVTATSPTARAGWMRRAGVGHSSHT